MRGSAGHAGLAGRSSGPIYEMTKATQFLLLI